MVLTWRSVVFPVMGRPVPTVEGTRSQAKAIERFGASLGPKDQTDFVCNGSDQGVRYGQNGQGTGRMPGFCITPGYKISAENGEVGIEPFDSGTAEEGAMLTQDQVRAIVEYERSLARD